MVKKVLRGWTVIFALLIVTERYLESKHIVDSVGLWYTIYVALVLSTVATGAFILCYFIIYKLFLKKRTTK